jgi:ribA/ribD-fused uncharacterized protein
MEAEKVKVIKFCKAEDKYGFLSNFSTHTFTLNGKNWKTVEHYYQSQKFVGTPYEDSIRMAATPGKAKKLGNARDAKVGPIRKDWSKVKEHVMYDALVAKFTQHKNLKVLLLETGNAILVEFSKKDSYWGDGGNGSGLNRLGALLMHLRQEIQNNAIESLVAAETSIPPQSSEPIYNLPPEEEEDFSESDDGVPKNLNSENLEDPGDPESINIEQINNIDDSLYAKGPSRPTSAQKARKKKNRNQMRKNVWKDQTGSSILARDNESRDQVSVVNQPHINIPMNVLPPSAKMVVHQHQYRRRYINDDEEAVEDDTDETFTGEEPEYSYERAGKNVKSTLQDYIVDHSKIKISHNKPTPNQPSQQQQPPPPLNPEECIASAAENLNLINLLSPTEPLFGEIKQNLIHLKPSLIQLIETTQQDNIMSQLLSQVEAINEIENK